MGSAGQLPLSFFYAFIDSGFFQTVLLILEIRKVKPRNRNSRLPPPSVSVTEEGCGAQALPTAPCLLHLQNATRCSWSAHPRLRDFTGQLRNFSRNRQRLSNTLLCQERMLKKNKEHCHYHLFNIITEPAGNTPAPRESEDRVGANRLFATSFQTSCPPSPLPPRSFCPASWPPGHSLKTKGPASLRDFSFTVPFLQNTVPVIIKTYFRRSLKCLLKRHLLGAAPSPTAFSMPLRMHSLGT